MAAYGTRQLTSIHGYVSKDHYPGDDYNLALPLYDNVINILSASQRTARFDTAKIRPAPPRNMNERFTGLQQLRDAIDPAVNNASYTLGEGDRVQNFANRDLNLLDSFIITRAIRAFIADFNAGMGGFNDNPYRVRELTDVQLSLDPEGPGGDLKLQIILVAKSGGMNRAWDQRWFQGDVAARRRLKKFFGDNNVGAKTMRERLRDLYKMVTDYFNKIADNDFTIDVMRARPERLELENVRAALYMIGNLGRVVLLPTTRGFTTFMKTYKKLETMEEMDIGIIRPELMSLIRALDRNSLENIGNAEMNNAYTPIIARARQLFQTAVENPEIDTQVVQRAQLEVIFEKDKNPKTLDNLSRRLAEAIEELAERRRGIENIPTLAGLVDSADYLQTEANKFRDFGDVLKKSIDAFTEDQWGEFKRTVFPKDYGKLSTATVTPDGANSGRIRVEVKRPNNARSWQHAGVGDHFAFSIDGERVFGRIDRDGGAATLFPMAGPTHITFHFPVDNIVKRYGKKRVELLFMNDADGTDPLYSVASEVDLGKSIPTETFRKAEGAATPGDLEIEVKLRLRDLYTDGQSHEGFVREIEAYVHKNGEKIEDGIQVPFAIIANDQVKTLNVPEAGNYQLTARMKTVGGDTPFQRSAPVAIAAPVVAPLAVGTRAERVKNVGTTDEHEALADESEADRVTSTAVVNAKSLEMDGHHTNIDQIVKEIRDIRNNPAMHQLRDGNPSLNTPLIASARDRIQQLEAEMTRAQALARNAEKEITVESSRSLEATVARESATQNIETAKSREVLEDIREAVAKPDPVTMGDFYKLLQRRSYNLPLSTGSPATEEFNKLSPADQTWSVSHRDKLRVFLEKRSLDRDEPVTGPEFIRVLQEAISSHMPSAVKQDQESFRATSRSILQARTKGIGKPFMRKNKRLRLRLA